MRSDLSPLMLWAKFLTDPWLLTSISVTPGAKGIVRAAVTSSAGVLGAWAFVAGGSAADCWFSSIAAATGPTGSCLALRAAAAEGCGVEATAGLGAGCAAGCGGTGFGAAADAGAGVGTGFGGADAIGAGTGAAGFTSFGVGAGAGAAATV